ncbi:Os08g0351700 [Oryza sativa Japonica Group]|uniref:Os08g0351700 protein n=1 Tax=Oryza sativa subsp. japonica TaxID=39947 RepID=Q6ZDT9_ORYSJ|nr:unknown protein [Oryza sativa Japonica Group]BAF23528.1 Os08g0351700 [Oryza sativa Japonica Group]|eukprot:NP_001061614.1 Os08g0351700 [Oryza sativa Japonica Group]
MVSIPKNRKLLAEIKVTLKIDGSRSDRSSCAGLTADERRSDRSRSIGRTVENACRRLLSPPV